MDEPPILKAKIRMEAINSYGVDYGYPHSIQCHIVVCQAVLCIKPKRV